MAKGLKAFISVFFYVSKRIYQTRKKLQRLAGLILSEVQKEEKYFQI